MAAAAIAMSIAADDTIDYVHRLSAQLAEDGDYCAAARRCHRSVGRAILYASITIALGFSILALSDLVPTINFGLLAGAAMLATLLADLTVLPVLLPCSGPSARPGRDDAPYAGSGRVDCKPAPGAAPAA